MRDMKGYNIALQYTHREIEREIEMDVTIIHIYNIYFLITSPCVTVGALRDRRKCGQYTSI
jgi:hypothetical protein